MGNFDRGDQLIRNLIRISILYSLKITVISSTETEDHSVECQNWSEVVQSAHVDAKECQNWLWFAHSFQSHVCWDLSEFYFQCQRYSIFSLFNIVILWYLDTILKMRVNVWFLMVNKKYWIFQFSMFWYFVIFCDRVGWCEGVMNDD